MKMKKNEFDMRKELESKPFKRHGFTESLRRRIEDRLDEEQLERGLWRWLPFAMGLCAAVLMIWLVNPPLPERSTEQSAHTSDQANSSLLTASEEAYAPSPVPLRSALLVAFRSDPAAHDETISLYRTLLIAPEQDRLAVVAEGETLIVPYGQAFWTFRQPAATQSGNNPPIELRPVSKAPDQTLAGSLVEEPLLFEQLRVLFAGNRFVSIQLPHTAGEASKEHADYHVYNYTDLMSAAKNGSVPVVALPELIEQEGIPQSEQWYIERSAGRWTAVAVESQSDKESPEAKSMSYTWELSPEVVSHDGLTISWKEIRSRQPGARDALESPTGELAVILTESHLFFYAIREGKLGEAPLLSTAIEDGEALIMAQWAIDNYVPLWIDTLTQTLNSQQSNE